MFITGSYPTINDYSQELLLKWHRQDPVSQKELDRNDAVYSFQYNRNPFIDYPQIAEYIWGDSTEYAFNFDGSAVVAPSISVKSGDIISFNGVLTNEVSTMQYRIKGSNITSSLYLRVDDTQNFAINRSSIPASELNSAQGAVIEITYHPQSQGLHRAVLEIACDDLPDDIEVVLQGACMPELPNFVMVDGLKSQYSSQDADVMLALKNYTEPVTWYIDDKPITGNIFSPSTLTPGRHKISFNNDHVRGDVRVTIYE